jgi:hypothetical protein
LSFSIAISVYAHSRELLVRFQEFFGRANTETIR